MVNCSTTDSSRHLWNASEGAFLMILQLRWTDIDSYCTLWLANGVWLKKSVMINTFHGLKGDVHTTTVRFLQAASTIVHATFRGTFTQVVFPFLGGFRVEMIPHYSQYITKEWNLKNVPEQQKRECITSWLAVMVNTRKKNTVLNSNAEATRRNSLKSKNT